MSPTARSLKYLRDKGYTAEVVERFNHYSKTRHDLFNFIDIVAIKVDERILAIQATSGDNHAARRSKLHKLENVEKFKRAGGAVVIHSWSKKVKRNKDGSKAKVKQWSLREEYL